MTFEVKLHNMKNLHFIMLAFIQTFDKIRFKKSDLIKKSVVFNKKLSKM